MNNNCRNHCEYDALKEDSDKLHSINIAIAGNRLPTFMIETVGAQARQTEKHQKRTLDVKAYVQILQDHINGSKIARSNIHLKSLLRRIEIPSTSSLANQEWEQETNDTKGMNPQLGNSNPMDIGEIHSDPVDTTMADQQQTLFVSIDLGSTYFSIAPPQGTMTIETFSTKSKRQALSLIALVQAIMLAVATEKESSHVNTAK